ncbi:copper resistance protein [uncultured Cedecea sp.]|uniref:copper resistance protein n=1 Tax=uncultured Cedecea sp. TaxID=988762 RepID=UPI0026146560|nr:copper resistance protein [uncultured Cedecea sp.]
MVKQQRLGLWFLCLACVVVLVCSAQRVLSLHALQTGTSVSVMLTQPDTPSQDDDTAVTPCELSAKSLLSMPPMLFDSALLTLGLLLLLLAPRRSCQRRFFPPRVISSPSLRVHLRFCVFQE